MQYPNELNHAILGVDQGGEYVVRTRLTRSMAVELANRWGPDYRVVTNEEAMKI